MRLRLTIAYDGTNYSGWQFQKIGIGVQQKVEEALAQVVPGCSAVNSSSRTDTGVHGLAMVAHVDMPPAGLGMPTRKLLLALNAHLPEDIRVMSVQRCAPDFHARFHTLGKEYRYYVWNHPAMNPLLRRQAWHVPKALDLSLMRAATPHFIGKRDFRSFAANRGYDFESTVREVQRCNVSRRGPLLTFRIEADGFLYRMCRGIVGTLVQVGLGRIDPATIPAILAQCDRKVAGMSAPAHGLFLWRVRYAKRATSGTVACAPSLHATP